jgi:hypothetical protein
MNTFQKLAVVLSATFMLLAIPAVAQMENGVRFDAPFAFYVGDAKMPAGSYTVTQPDDNLAVLLVQDADGSHSAFITFRPVNQDTAPSETRVGFKRYGGFDFLNHIMVRGENTHIIIEQSQSEEAAASATVAEEHSLPATGDVTVHAASSDVQPIINGSN